MLAALGGALIVAGIYLVANLAAALIAAGLLTIAYAALLVEVPERPEHAAVSESGVAPLGASRAGR